MNKEELLERSIEEYDSLIDYMSEMEAELGASAYHSGFDRTDALQIARNDYRMERAYKRKRELETIIKELGYFDRKVDIPIVNNNDDEELPF